MEIAVGTLRGLHYLWLFAHVLTDEQVIRERLFRRYRRLAIRRGIGEAERQIGVFVPRETEIPEPVGISYEDENIVQYACNRLPCA
jgi:hypothetical protein